MDFVPVVATWRLVLVADFLRYFLTAAPFYLVFWLWRPRWLRGRRIQPVDPGRAQVLSEISVAWSGENASLVSPSAGISHNTGSSRDGVSPEAGSQRRRPTRA